MYLQPFEWQTPGFDPFGYIYVQKVNLSVFGSKLTVVKKLFKFWKRIISQGIIVISSLAFIITL